MLDGFQQMVHGYRGCVISAPTVRPGETVSPDIAKISTERASESRGINYSKVVNSINISNLEFCSDLNRFKFSES